ncbi:MAG TPA: hypothetical protein VLE97_09040 [Gaiellaceae bacterium]|nr:hypothetical protein [Gaiellaceae bacterium]
MTSFETAVFCLGCVAFGHGMAHLMKRWNQHRARARGSDDKEFSTIGLSVEVDCRSCGKFNRVPGHRLRDKPKCGQCKTRLMPGKRVVLCRVRPMEGPLRSELDAVWTDEEKLWQALADHVALENKAAAESKNPSLRAVN